MKAYRWCSIGLATLIAFFASVVIVYAFAEEPLGFRDPATGIVYEGVISTIHDDLTYALAIAAGFSVTDSRKLQIYNQLVDSEHISGTAYTNCGGSFNTAPTAASVCGAGPWPNVVWPQYSSMYDTNTCATSRFGVYSPFFHFPHRLGPLGQRDIGALHDWAWGITQTLRGYEAYAWGKAGELTVFSASCRYTRTTEIVTSITDTGIPPGTLQAFATYLHSLADSYSHQDCIAAMDALGMPWPTHTTLTLTECLYHPNTMTATDVHGREFFTYTDSARTDAAIGAVYAELVSRSLRYEGQYYPVSLGVTLTQLTGTPTLSQALSNFVHTWDYNHPSDRRAYADAIAAAALAQRMPIRRAYMPVLLR